MTDERIEVLKEEWARMMTFRTHNIELAAERDALAVQNDALREALKFAHSCPTVDETGERCEGCPASEAFALDAPRAAKIAEARRRVCEAAISVSTCTHAGNMVNTCAKCLFVLNVALAELRKADE